MRDRLYVLTAVHFNGDCERTEFSGFRAEILGDRLYKELSQDTKYVFVLLTVGGLARATMFRGNHG